MKQLGVVLQKSPAVDLLELYRHDFVPLNERPQYYREQALVVGTILTPSQPSL